ncbi:DUF3465 domain-containing protein [Salinisphaera aquimarina]|uniref:DUF3465 domain-containing protein n=1 Tax=Salinisphaera aquimarina TaxID=2094031 RepID=A0ABV7ENP9_9GAMM
MNSTLKKYLPLLVVAIAAFLGAEQFGLSDNSSADRATSRPSAPSTRSGNDADAAIAKAYRAKAHDVRVRGEGRVSAVLQDDTRGSRHQRFILRLASGNTVLVAHNIDLAPRIPSLRKGDTVGFNGIYEYNERGGVVHWTHRDPGGRHAGGWLEHAGQRYQ